jgi:hypothetical protein
MQAVPIASVLSWAARSLRFEMRFCEAGLARYAITDCVVDRRRVSVSLLRNAHVEISAYSYIEHSVLVFRVILTDRD